MAVTEVTLLLVHKCSLPSFEFTLLVSTAQSTNALIKLHTAAMTSTTLPCSLCLYKEKAFLIHSPATWKFANYTPGVNSTFCNLLGRLAIVDVRVLFICGPPPQNEQKLQSSGAHSKKRHLCHTSLGYARWGKDCCHDDAVKVSDMVEYNDWAYALSLCNVLPALHPQSEEVESEGDEYCSPEPAHHG